MIKCVILDDELLAISYLKLLCEQIENVEVVKAFNDPNLFLNEIENIDCNVCIVDIEMPGMNGLQVAEHIPDSKKIIFTTAYKEYAAEAFDLNVVDYVRKPIKRERLAQAFEKAGKLVQNTHKKGFHRMEYQYWQNHHLYQSDCLHQDLGNRQSRQGHYTQRRNNDRTEKP
ncbi:LytR/AlgR family response regulator transcription factor [Chryseobacterium nepalense]|uniref:LytR/AlgR family response regulator transcription factor n=1 Tax=Chryseobacterium nepalense TaxID=1854498 RepID=UPI002DF849E9|nr:two-component SAPR family response regulator [Chryseobacterium nepalense]